jgi:hypothetical protein
MTVELEARILSADGLCFLGGDQRFSRPFAFALPSDRAEGDDYLAIAAVGLPEVQLCWSEANAVGL